MGSQPSLAGVCLRSQATNYKIFGKQGFRTAWSQQRVGAEKLVAQEQLNTFPEPRLPTTADVTHDQGEDVQYHG